MYFRNPEGEDVTFYGASDAAFADHRETRRSSQGYLFMLFEGLIDWKATLQRSVTRSTTEAGLLSLSTAAVEIIWRQRFFEAIGFNLEREFTLLCDNMQTVCLLRQDTPKLDTKLRHINVQQHWLRQEVQDKKIDVRWVPTDKMPADRLTKILPCQKHEAWIKQLNLVDIRHQITTASSSN